MDKRKEIVERVKKLLRLSESDNIHEAATAAGMAQGLIEKHNIEQELLDKEEYPKDKRVFKGPIFKHNKARLNNK